MAAIAAGGAPGAFCRYALSVAIPSHSRALPWATFWENVSGSFLLGVLVTLIAERFPRAPLTPRLVRAVARPTTSRRP